ncbi:hypothetical protein PCANB_002109 [Pneumocystis canis]|nr:hypothetical protein PCANB_002109 [Pneumocystis canis]
MNIKNLTDKELDILQSFKSITQINDSKTSIEILENYEWDLERAISSIYKDHIQEEIHPSEDSMINSEDMNYTHDSFQQSSEVFRFCSPNLNTRQFQKSNPRDISEKFIQEFEKKHGTTHIPFFEGGYTEGLTTLTDEKLIQFIINNNILVWAGSVHEPEAFQVSNSLNCTRFPFITISIPHLHPNTSNMSSLARIEGFISPNDMIATLETYIAQHLPTIQQLRIAKREQLITRQIRAQQDNAYKTSLAIDRERMLQREKEKKHKAEIERKKQRELDNAKILETNKIQWKLWRASKLFPEPTSNSCQIAKISLRLQNGERIIRKFDANASIEEIYAFIECRDINTNKFHKPLEPPLNYIHKFNFQLVSPIPRQIIKQDTKQKILEEKSLFPNGNIIDLDEDKSD